MSISGNNQQFIDDKTLHFRDVENTFEYMQNFFVEAITPRYISNSGNTTVRMKGMLFDQFKYDNGTTRNVTLQYRFVDKETGTPFVDPSKMTKVSDIEEEFLVPKNDHVGDAKIQISANGQQWQDVDHPVRFYNGPKVTRVNPTYGVTKNPRNQKLEIFGDNFVCPDGDCTKIKVRFQNSEGKEIFVDGKYTD